MRNGPVGAAVAGAHAVSGWAPGRSPDGDQRGVLAEPDRLPVAGSARLLRDWKTVYNRHRRWSAEGTWAQILDELRCGCDQNAHGAADPRWAVGTDSTVVRAHQHAAGARRTPPPHLVTEPAVEAGCPAEATTGGAVE
jgi:hypothetical protein